jgi:hypothetical protein
MVCRSVEHNTIFKQFFFQSSVILIQLSIVIQTARFYSWTELQGFKCEQNLCNDATKIQKLRRVNYAALRFTAETQDLGKQEIRILR